MPVVGGKPAHTRMHTYFRFANLTDAWQQNHSSSSNSSSFVVIVNCRNSKNVTQRTSCRDSCVIRIYVTSEEKTISSV